MSYTTQASNKQAQVNENNAIKCKHLRCDDNTDDYSINIY